MTRREQSSLWTIEHCEVVDYGSTELEPGRVVKNGRGRVVAVLLDGGSIARAPGDYVYCTAQDDARPRLLTWLWAALRNKLA